MEEIGNLQDGVVVVVATREAFPCIAGNSLNLARCIWDHAFEELVFFVSLV